MPQTLQRSQISSTPSYLTYKDEEKEEPIPTRSRKVGHQIVNFTIKAVDEDDNSQILNFPVVFSTKGGYELSKLKKHQDLYPAFKRYNRGLKIKKVLDIQTLNSGEEIPSSSLTPIILK